MSGHEESTPDHKKRLIFWGASWVLTIAVLIGLAVELNEYLADGEEQKALVLELLETSQSSQNTSYTYLLEIGNQQLRTELSVKLAVGDRITVLVLNKEPIEFVVGSKESSLLDLYLGLWGNQIMGILTLAALLLCVLIIPKFIMDIRKQIENAQSGVREMF